MGASPDNSIWKLGDHSGTEGVLLTTCAKQEHIGNLLDENLNMFQCQIENAIILYFKYKVNLSCTSIYFLFR